jgi:hypothetical protein
MMGHDAKDGLQRAQLLRLAEEIDAQPNWWRFPSEPENRVDGFLGTGRIFIVGDQPSTSDWGFDHPHRRAYYDLLSSLNAGGCHLTDLYKCRGRSSQLKDGKLPTDFDDHLDFFFEEVKLLKPFLVLAMGKIAHDLLSRHLPRLPKEYAKPHLKKVWHFGTVRHGKQEQFESILQAAILEGSRLNRA